MIILRESWERRRGRREGGERERDRWVEEGKVERREGEGEREG